jgi:hypothetical protein
MVNGEFMIHDDLGFGFSFGQGLMSEFIPGGDEEDESGQSEDKRDAEEESC